MNSFILYILILATTYAPCWPVAHPVRGEKRPIIPFLYNCCIRCLFPPRLSSCVAFGCVDLSLSSILWRRNFLDTVSGLHPRNFSSVISGQLIPFARKEATSKQSAADGLKLARFSELSCLSQHRRAFFTRYAFRTVQSSGSTLETCARRSQTMSFFPSAIEPISTQSAAEVFEGWRHFLTSASSLPPLRIILRNPYRTVVGLEFACFSWTIPCQHFPSLRSRSTCSYSAAVI
jgi:hypothetical protein